VPLLTGHRSAQNPLPALGPSASGLSHRSGKGRKAARRSDEHMLRISSYRSARCLLRPTRAGRRRLAVRRFGWKPRWLDLLVVVLRVRLLEPVDVASGDLPPAPRQTLRMPTHLDLFPACHL